MRNFSGLGKITVKLKLSQGFGHLCIIFFNWQLAIMDQKGSKLGGPCSSHSSSLPPSVRDACFFSFNEIFPFSQKKKKNHPHNESINEYYVIQFYILLLKLVSSTTNKKKITKFNKIMQYLYQLIQILYLILL